MIPEANDLRCDEDHRRQFRRVLVFAYFRGLKMQRPSTAQTVFKPAIAGEQAGFSLEEMIQMLNAGITVETLLQLIEWHLGEVRPSPARSSRWIM
jgi:hypothetical protein